MVRAFKIACGGGNSSFSHVSSGQKMSNYKMSLDDAVRVCWDVQPDSFEILLKGEKAKKLRTLIREKDEAFKFTRPKGTINNWPNNADIQIFEKQTEGDAPSPVTPYHRALVVDGPEDDSLILYVHAQRGGLRPESEAVTDKATHLTLFQSGATSKTQGSGTRKKEKTTLQYFTKPQYDEFINASLASRYNIEKEKHEMPDSLREAPLNEFIKKTDYWNKGIFLSVLGVVSGFPSGICGNEKYDIKRLEKFLFFAANTPHCVFFDVSVETSKNEGILLKFVINKDESKKCKTAVADGQDEKGKKGKPAPTPTSSQRPQKPKDQPPTSPEKKVPNTSEGSSSSSKGRAEPNGTVPRSNKISNVDEAASVLMTHLRSAYESFTPPAGADKTGLQQLIATKSFPQFEQREAYTIEADQALWEKIRTFLDTSEKQPDGVEGIYAIFGGLKWFEEDPAAANLRNILDACISLWKFRTLNPVAEVHVAAT